MAVNLFLLARGWLVDSTHRLTAERLAAFEADCRQRRAAALTQYHVQLPAPRTPGYRDAREARARAQQQLSVLVPALRCGAAVRQALVRKSRRQPERLALLLLSRATRTPPQNILNSDAPTGPQHTTQVQAETATELLRAHADLFGDLPAALVGPQPLRARQYAAEQAEMRQQKTALLNKILGSGLQLTAKETAALRRFLG